MEVGCKLKKPCHNCPFRRSARYMSDGQVRRNLTWVRNPGHVIVCHHTVTHFVSDGTGHGERKQVCAGALIFQQRAGLLNFFALGHGVELPDCTDVYSSLCELATRGAATPEQYATYVGQNKVHLVRLRLGRRQPLIMRPSSTC